MAIERAHETHTQKIKHIARLSYRQKIDQNSDKKTGKK